MNGPKKITRHSNKYIDINKVSNREEILIQIFSKFDSGYIMPINTRRPKPHPYFAMIVSPPF
jgi:hypothetical protein